jgi:GntR family transcriptional regulator, transcriptional repressor for pyruvate dehydrogenase complex
MATALQSDLQPRRNLTLQLVENLSARIERRELAPGDKLPTESELMAAYGVSRTVVREAISRLQAAGIVETRHGIGTFVLEAPARNPLSIEVLDVATIKEVLAVMELRISLETEAAALAATRRSNAQLGEMRRALDAVTLSIDNAGDAVTPDFEFHRQIALATDNRHFADLLGYLGPRIIPRARVNTAQLAHEQRSEYLRRVNREHEDIYAAIVRGDSEAARAAMRDHLANSRERIKRAHESAGAPR